MRVSVPVEIAAKALQLTEKEGTLLEWRRKINYALSGVRRRRLALLEVVDFPKEEAPAGHGGNGTVDNGATTRRNVAKTGESIKRKLSRKGARRG